MSKIRSLVFVSERILGHVHANTANAYLQLGYTQVQAGKFGEAEEALRWK